MKMNSCDFCEWSESETAALIEREQGLIDRIETLEAEVAALKVEASWTPAAVKLRDWI